MKTSKIWWSFTDFTSSLIEISKECIPQTSTNPTNSNPWYNGICKEAIEQSQQAQLNSQNANNLDYIYSYLQKLDLMQNQNLRLALGASCAPIASLYAEAD